MFNGEENCTLNIKNHTLNIKKIKYIKYLIIKMVMVKFLTTIQKTHIQKPCNQNFHFGRFLSARMAD